MIDHISPTQISQLQAPINGFYQHIHAGNGEFVRAKRPGLHAMIKISDAGTEGCLPLVPMLDIDNRISPFAMTWIYQDFLYHMPNERLAWVTDTLEVVVPDQVATRSMVRAKNVFDPQISDVIFDVHSHNTMSAYFSIQDDKDESKGFRVFIVIGQVASQMPQISARVGIFGHFMGLPIQTVADVPAALNLEDMYAID